MSSDAADWAGEIEFRRVLADLRTTGTIVAEGKRIDANRFDEILEIGLRLLGPLFFGLALLSLRGRVKR